MLRVRSRSTWLGVVERVNGVERAVDLVVAVRERHEHRLELGGRDVDAAREQMAEERGVTRGAARRRVVEVPHRAIRVEEREHRADAVDAPEGGESRLEPRASALELAVHGGVTEAPQHREAG